MLGTEKREGGENEGICSILPMSITFRVIPRGSKSENRITYGGQERKVGERIREGVGRTPEPVLIYNGRS